MIKKYRFKQCVSGNNFQYNPYTWYQPYEYMLEEEVAKTYIDREIAYEVVTEENVKTVPKLDGNTRKSKRNKR